MTPSPHKPTLHHAVPLHSRVLIPLNYHKDKGERRAGTVTGIASMHVIFGYIVTLDAPLETEYGIVTTVVVNGPELESTDGSNWRIA